MKTYNEILEFTTNERFEILNITSEIIKCVEESEVEEGLCLVFPLHTTSGVFINDVDSNLIDDIKEFMEKLVPEKGNYSHNGPHEANADGHIRQLLAGHSITLPVNDGNLYLGHWQTIYYAEYDGQREKEVLVKIIGI